MIECTRFKSFPKGSLVGFADLKLQKSGIEIFGCSLHQSNGKRWVNLPSKEYKDEKNETKYQPVVRFTEMSHYNAFVDQALKAIDAKAQQEATTPKEPEFEEEPDLPF